jgi:mono/diheme cytochrome c family protein
VAVIASAIVIVVGIVIVRPFRHFDAPLPPLGASDDRALIERGRYLVNGPAHCVACHGDGSPTASDHPLSGGFAFDLPLGRIRAPNLTPDVTTGIGSMTDGEIARALRYGVGRDGRALVALMSFGDLGDDDLRAIVSYLRTQPAVHHEIPPNEWTLLGRMVRAFVMKPSVVAAHPRRAPPPSRATAAYGEYLATAVANCSGCHTERDLRTGRVLGPAFAGGMTFPSLTAPDEQHFVSANLTPDPATGRITSWSEDGFIARFRAGPRFAGSPMPWRAFGAMNDDDLRAIFRYLRSLPPVRRETPPPPFESVASR